VNYHTNGKKIGNEYLPDQWPPGLGPLTSSLVQNILKKYW
jgi:hypothetical protein